jgi:AcrR family transcriptional regulator
MDERVKRIVKTAMGLAEEGGFEAVRLRDVAAHAQVALGTLYRRFESKEAILVAALELEAEALEARMAKKTIAGATPLSRANAFFAFITPTFFRRANLSRAILRSVVSGNPDITKKAAAFHDRMTEMVAATLAGDEDLDTDARDYLRRVAYTLQQVWFAGLVGWMGGIHTQAQVIQHVHDAAELILGGSNSTKRGKT